MGQADTGTHQDESKGLVQHGKEQNVVRQNRLRQKKRNIFSSHLLEHSTHLLQYILTQFKNVTLNFIPCDISI
jgi:hypothetical protein